MCARVCLNECIKCECHIWGCICGHTCVHLCEWMKARAHARACVYMCGCVWMGAPGQAIRYWCSRLRVCRGKWMCACVRACLCVYRGSCCVVKRRLVKDGQHWYDQSSVDQDVLLPPRCSFSLNLTVNSLSFTSLSFFLFHHSVSFHLSLNFTLLLHLLISKGNSCIYIHFL